MVLGVSCQEVHEFGHAVTMACSKYVARVAVTVPTPSHPTPKAD